MLAGNKQRQGRFGPADEQRLVAGTRGVASVEAAPGAALLLAGPADNGWRRGGFLPATGGLAGTAAGVAGEEAAVAAVSPAGRSLQPMPASDMLPNRRTAARVPDRG